MTLAGPACDVDQRSDRIPTFCPAALLLHTRPVPAPSRPRPQPVPDLSLTKPCPVHAPLILFQFLSSPCLAGSSPAPASSLDRVAALSQHRLHTPVASLSVPYPVRSQLSPTSCPRPCPLHVHAAHSKAIHDYFFGFEDPVPLAGNTHSLSNNFLNEDAQQQLWQAAPQVEFKF